MHLFHAVMTSTNLQNSSSEFSLIRDCPSIVRHNVKNIAQDCVSYLAFILRRRASDFHLRVNSFVYATKCGILPKFLVARQLIEFARNVNTLRRSI